MTKNEFNDLYDSLNYGHDVDLVIEEHRFFLEWNKNGLTIYKMQGDTGSEIVTLQGENHDVIVKKLFDFCFLAEKSLNKSYQEISILDIE